MRREKALPEAASLTWGIALLSSVDGVVVHSYLKPEWAVAGSHVIEPTGPMMGPNAVADVMPREGRQMSW
jgi:hypothetical protein